MIPQTQLTILEAASSPKTISTISHSTELDPEQVQHIATTMETTGLVELTTTNQTVTVRRRRTPVSESFDQLCIEATHIDFPELLTPLVQRVCWFLDRTFTIREISRYLHDPIEKIEDTVDMLQRRAIVMSTDGEQYTLHPSMKRLADLSHTLSRYKHSQHIEQLAPGAYILWASPCEAVVSARDGRSDDGYQYTDFENASGWSLTGIGAFQNYDLKFLLGHQPLFHYSELTDTLTVEQLACHTLMTGRDLRRAKYALVLLTKTGFNADKLEQLGKYYDMPDITQALSTYIENKGEVDVNWFPSWQGYCDVLEQYDVSI